MGLESTAIVMLLGMIVSVSVCSLFFAVGVYVYQEITKKK